MVEKNWETIERLLATVPATKDRFLNVPTWGWSNSGKTCAILTAAYFADPAEHGLSLEVVDDYDELDAVRQAVPVYSGLGVENVARSTTARITEMQDRFLVQSKWPLGTDDPTGLLLRIAGRVSTLGYVYLPDLPGGDFQGSEAVARTVLKAAHACALVVDPIRYASVGPAAKRYRSAVSQRLILCAELKVPTAVLLTMDDQYPPEAATELDEAQRKLGVVLDAKRASLGEDAPEMRVFRVSVIGKDVEPDEEGDTSNPPPPEKRDPAEMVYAWNWLLAHALKTDLDVIYQKVPPLRLRASTVGPKYDTPIPEIREVGVFSGAPSSVLCALPPRGDRHAFLVENGDMLLRAELSDVAGDRPQLQKMGKHPGFETDHLHRAAVKGGELFVGPRRGVDGIWVGHVEDEVAWAGFPATLQDWVVVGPRRVVGVEQSGRISLLVRQGAEWNQAHYLAGFIPNSGVLVLGFDTRNNLVVCLNGDGDVRGVKLTTGDRFGERVEVVQRPTFADPATEYSSSGVLALRRPPESEEENAEDDDVESWDDHGSLRLSISFERKSQDLGDVVPGRPSWSLAPTAPMVAWVDAEQFLRVAYLDNETFLTEDQPAALRSTVTSLVWSTDSCHLICTFEDGTWAHYELVGWPRE